MSGLLLLDVNALVALGWEQHEHHAAVLGRLHVRQAWASCAITQLGFIRISSIPGLFHVSLTPAQAADVLAGLLADAQHRVLPDIPAVSSVDWAQVSSSKHTTDAYLVVLANASEAHLLTLDRQLAARYPDRVELLRP
ncbi:MAG: hypothetical protein MUE46_08700 [Xanthomonadales bacterium]|nr:hypothetical protein [Xanthomonadales bacterium]